LTVSFKDTAANDYKVFDGTETVTYHQLAGDAAVTVTSADGQEFTAREILFGNGLFRAGDKRWALGANQIPAGREPKQGSTITDAAGVVWTLTADATLDDFGISWTCVTTKAR
jgi:hypothetical protein